MAGGGPAGSRGPRLVVSACAWPWPPRPLSPRPPIRPSPPASSRCASSCRRPIWAAPRRSGRGRRLCFPRRPKPRPALSHRSTSASSSADASPCARSSSPCAGGVRSIFVPSSATWPSFTSPACSHSLRTCPSSPEKAPSSAACGSRRRCENPPDRARNAEEVIMFARRLGHLARRVDAVADSRTATAPSSSPGQTAAARSRSQYAASISTKVERLEQSAKMKRARWSSPKSPRAAAAAAADLSSRAGRSGS